MTQASPRPSAYLSLVIGLGLENRVPSSTPVPLHSRDFFRKTQGGGGGGRERGPENSYGPYSEHFSTNLTMVRKLFLNFLVEALESPV